MESHNRNKLTAFFVAEGKNLRRYVLGKLRHISEADAEDIIGDVMLKLFTRSESVDLLDNPAGYVYRAIQNKIIDHTRTRARLVSLEHFLDENGEQTIASILADTAPGPQDLLERKELLCRLGEAIDRLEPKQRAVLLATELDGLSFKALSMRWGEPVGTLLSRKSRALKALRKMLSDDIL
ncbi:RNA polymerase sigma factor [Oscillospiraceae bacterium WX1]